jgi:hypothetical protein
MRCETLNSNELAKQVTDCVESLRDRITGVGHDQYANGDQQAIELKSNTQLITEAVEELDDFIVYAVVLRSRIEALRLSIQNW